jgi:hypothetical protein
MISLARFILKGPSQAAMIAATMAILGMLLLPAAWLSAAAIALVVLVNGTRAGTQVMAYALAGSSVFAWLIFGTPLLAFYFVLIVWLPVWLPAVILKQTVSLANSLLLVGVLSLLAVLSLYLVFPGMEEIFRPALQQLSQRLAEQYQGQISLQQLQQASDWVLRVLPGLFVSSMLFGAMISLFLARWWQAVLYNPGGFAKEFQSLQLGKTSALVAVAIVVLAVMFESDMVDALLMVVFTLYLMQGTAILHAVVNGRQLNKIWLVVIYGLVFMIPHMVVLLAMLGVADAYIDIRQRLLSRTGG